MECNKEISVYKRKVNDQGLNKKEDQEEYVNTSHICSVGLNSIYHFDRFKIFNLIY